MATFGDNSSTCQPWVCHARGQRAKGRNPSARATSEPSSGTRTHTGQVERNACPSEERQHDEGNPDGRDVRAKLSEPSGYTAQDPIADRPAEQFRLVLAVFTRLDIHGRGSFHSSAL